MRRRPTPEFPPRTRRPTPGLETARRAARRRSKGSGGPPALRADGARHRQRTVNRLDAILLVTTISAGVITLLVPDASDIRTLLAMGRASSGTGYVCLDRSEAAAGACRVEPPAGYTRPMTVTSSAPGPGLLRRTFRSLHTYNFRLFFISQVISMSGTWMQSVAQNWLVLSLTGSSVDLGITVGLQFGPVLLPRRLGRHARRPRRQAQAADGDPVGRGGPRPGARRPRRHRRRHRVDDLGAHRPHGHQRWRWASRRSRASCTRWSGRTTSPTPSGSTRS